MDGRASPAILAVARVRHRAAFRWSTIERAATGPSRGPEPRNEVDEPSIAGRALRRRPAAELDCRRRARARSRSPIRPTARSTPHAVERHPRLPRADRRSARRQASIRSPASPAGGKPMVGPGQPIDTDRYFVICPNVIGGCMGTTGPASINPATGQPWGARLSRHHHPRHGAGAGDAARPSRHRAAVLRRRRLDGRHAGAAMGGELSRARVRALPIATARAPLGAEHRLPRGRPAGDDGRSRLAGRPLSGEGGSPRRGLAVARMAAHITYLSEAALHRKFGRKLQDRERIRPSRSTPISRSRAICAIRAAPSSSASTPTPISIITRAMDYFDLAADYGGVLANAFRGTPTRFCVVSFTSRLAVPDDGLAGRSCMRSTPPARGCRSSRSRPTRATTPSCSTSRSCSPSCAASSMAPPARGLAAGR